jgi:aspartate carbamoyltransferase catalytic subunit
MGTDNAGEFSSAIKGESLEDSIKVISTYSDIIVLRHKENSAAELAATVSECSIINAGSGTGQHPTQSLLDLYTIRDRLSEINGINIAIVGDLKHGRTARSLAYLLGKYQNITINFVAHPEMQIDTDILNYLDRHSIKYKLLNNIEDIIKNVDVVYQTRSQKERHYGSVNYNLKINAELAETMKNHAIIMHPLPRNDEIAPEVDRSHRAAYFDQAANGLWIRMAILTQLF